jgi:hypothetical protein
MPLNKNHRIFFTLTGNLIFHRKLLFGIIFAFRMVLYIDLTVNWPLSVSDYLNTSRWSFRCILTIRTRLFHARRLCPTSALRKDILKGVLFKTSDTVEFLLLAILYRLGYCSFKVEFPSQISSQNLICVSLCNLKFPRVRNWFLTFIKPAQNWESPVFLSTWVIIFVPIYLFHSNYCQSPSSFISLYSHLLSKHLFWIYKSKIPKPPCSFGR